MAAELSERQGTRRWAGLQSAVWWELLAVLAIFLAALALRTYRLHEWPPGLFNDEAANGLDGLALLRGERPIFFPRNTGREPLFLYLQAGMMALLGPTSYALRLTAAIVGALAVPAAYWMVRELFWGSPVGARRVALWSALFMAFGYWQISLNRIGFRANMLPLLAAVTFALFWRAWRTLLRGRRFPWLMSVLTGIALGVAQYTYTASRFLPVLLTLMVLATVLRPSLERKVRLRALGALAIIGLTSAVVFAPLGWYFVQHPEQFSGRAASVSFMSEAFSQGNPLLTLVTTIGKLGLMFLTLGDPNLRHNPGQRPAFDLLLGLWFYAGLTLCLVKWHQLPYLFLAAWTLLLALPAILTPEAAPHSLRATGMIPAVYVLPVLAMLAAAAWLAPHTRLNWRKWLPWLPLPFLLFSAGTSVQGYFGAWRDIGGFTGVFMTNYASLADAMAKAEDKGVWIMPLSPNYFLVEPQFYAMDFAAAGKMDFGGISVDPSVAGQQLTAALKGKQTAQLVRARNSDRFPEAGYILDDPKHLIKFLLDKYGVQTAERDDKVVGMPYLVYRLPEQADYTVFGTEEPTNWNFDGKVTLSAVSYGQTAQAAPGVGVNAHAVPSGQPLWVTLRWRADAPIDVDLKTSLSLQDAAGHVAGQVDDLLVGDRYPVQRTWQAGEETASYHIVPQLPGLAPGQYDLVLRVYEDQSQRPYPVLAAAGAPAGIDTVIGSVEVLPAGGTQQVEPQEPLAEAPQLAPGLALLGYDLPTATVAPGGTLPLTLYWQADGMPQADYSANLQLRSGDGTVVAEQTQPLAGGTVPTGRWTGGTTVRDWQDLALKADVPNGSYHLWLALTAGEQRSQELDLGEVTVEGRPHGFVLPPLATTIGAVFGHNVRLAGLQNAPAPSGRPGDTLEVPLVWQVLEPSARPLVRFVHLLGANGKPLAQHDSAPCEGECPSASWLAGEVLTDTVTLTIPGDAPAGSYSLAAGWYDGETLQRLEARDAEGAVLPDGLAPLANVEVAQ
ncbi:MAG: glycosyltransferase family 39 protein [Caldilineaceae bacterium]